MSTITQHAPGTFCWPELGTTDEAAAKKFYTSLFGWTVNEFPMGDMGTYNIFQLGGRDVAAMYQLTADMLKQGTPPHWEAYVSVTSADDAAKKIKELGGNVIMEPFDVMEHGRMAVAQDPQGAFFCVWEAKKTTGVAVLNEPGSLGWTQLNAKDTGKAKTFYTSLFGWKTQDDPMADGSGLYTTFKRGDVPAGGMMTMPAAAGPIPSHWLTYFAVSDVDAAAKKAKDLGAVIHVPPTDIPDMGRFAVLMDPQNSAFAIVKFNAQM